MAFFSVKKYGRGLLSFAVLIAVVVMALLFFRKTPDVTLGASPKPEQTLPAASPQPFLEMTIPYLRSRAYQSQISQLHKITENANYTSYLTSYTSDNLKINALLTQPKGTVPSGGWPAIVFIHGYIPPAQYRTQEKYIAYVDYLAAHGFAVLKIDLRGHGDSEGQASGAYYSEEYIVDTLNAYAALQKVSFVNPAQIGLWGHSMAGNIVLRALAAKPDIPAAVIWAGAVYSYQDFLNYGLHETSYRPPSQLAQRQQRRQQLFAAHGQFTLNSNFWKQVAPTNYLADLKGAIEVHHAVDDEVVSISYTRDLAKLLDQTSVPHQVFEYPTGGHNISGPSFTLAIQRSSEFFHQYLDHQFE